MFLDRNALWFILKDVRHNYGDPDKGLDRIWKMVHSASGTILIVDRLVKWVADEEAYLQYINTSSSVIRISDNNSKSSISIHSELRHKQLTEILLIERTIMRINKALDRIEDDTAVKIYLDRKVLNKSIREIKEQYGIGYKKYHSIQHDVELHLKYEFKLYCHHAEDELLEKMLKRYKL